MALLEDRDIDEWFDEEKRRLSDELFDQLDRGVEPEKAVPRFNKEFRRLLETYDKNYRVAASVAARKALVDAPLRRFREWRHDRATALSLWWKQKAEERHRAKFEREYRRLFHLKKKTF